MESFRVVWDSLLIWCQSETSRSCVVCTFQFRLHVLCIYGFFSETFRKKPVYVIMFGPSFIKYVQKTLQLLTSLMFSKKGFAVNWVLKHIQIFVSETESTWETLRKHRCNLSPALTFLCHSCNIILHIHTFIPANRNTHTHSKNTMIRNSSVAFQS